MTGALPTYTISNLVKIVAFTFLSSSKQSLRDLRLWEPSLPVATAASESPSDQPEAAGSFPHPKLFVSHFPFQGQGRAGLPGEGCQGSELRACNADWEGGKMLFARLLSLLSMP